MSSPWVRFFGAALRNTINLLLSFSKHCSSLPCLVTSSLAPYLVFLLSSFWQIFHIAATVRFLNYPCASAVVLQPDYLTLLFLLPLFLPLSFLLSFSTCFLPSLTFFFLFYLFPCYLLSACYVSHRYRQSAVVKITKTPALKGLTFCRNRQKLICN